MASYAGKDSSFYSTTGGVPKQGAWYSAMQAWQDPQGNWTLSSPGSINQFSNQVGAGKPVSAEVIAQTNPGNVAYVNTQRQNAGLPPVPQTTQQAQATLNDFGSTLFENAPNTGVQSYAEIADDLRKSGILPEGTAPTPPSLAETYQQLADAKGVEAIQGSINDLKSQQDAIASQLQVTKTAEQGKPVAQNVISGRISQEQQQAQDQYDFIGRQLSRKQDELNSTLGNIKMIMDFTQQDYTNASNAYNTQFDQAITTFNLIHGIQQDQKTDAQRAQDNARANLQIMVNAVTNGNLSLSNLGADQQAQLNKLEVQSGLPVGFMQSLQMDPGKNIVYSGKADNGQIQVLTRDASGNLSMNTYGTASSSGSTTAGKANLVDKAQTYLDTVANSYGDVTPSQWNAALNAYVSDGGLRATFISTFSKYTDKNRGDFSSAYGFPNPGK